MVPAAAFAEAEEAAELDEAAIEEVVVEEEAEEAAIELEAEPEEEAEIDLEATTADDFSQGMVTAISAMGNLSGNLTAGAAADSYGSSFANAVSTNATTYAAGASLTLGDNTKVVIGATTVVTKQGTSQTVSDVKNYKVTVYEGTAAAAGKEVADNTITKAGKYTVEVEAIGEAYNGGKATLLLNVSSANFPAGIKAYLVKKDGSLDDSGTSHAPAAVSYAAEDLKFGFANVKSDNSALDVTLKEGADYTVTYYQGSTQVSSVKNAGDYTAHLEGLGKYAGSTLNVAVKVNQLDLATAINKVGDEAGGFYVADVYSSDTTPASNPQKPTTVNGSKALAQECALDYSTLDTSIVNGDYGAYKEITLKVADPTNQNVTGSKKVSSSVNFNKYGAEVSILYKGAAITDDQEVVINLGNKETIALTDFTAKNGSADVPVDTSGTDKVIVAVEKTKTQGGKALTSSTSNLANMVDTNDDNEDSPSGTKGAGEYLVTLTYTPASGFELGGKKTLKVKVVSESVDADASMFVSAKKASSTEASFTGTNYDKGVELTYDPAGTNNALSNRIQVKVAKKDGTLASGTVKFTDAEGKEVTGQAPDAGEYTATVTVDGVEIKNNTFKVIVKPITVTELRIRNIEKATVNGEVALPYDSDATDATVQAYNLVTGAQYKYNKDVSGTPTATYLITDDMTGASGDTSKMFILQYADGSKDADGKTKWFDYTATAVANATNLTWTLNGKDVSAKVTSDSGLKDDGTYTLSIAAKTADSKNFDISAKPIEITIAKALRFTDVPETKGGQPNWQYEVVNKAADLGYMTGIGGTTLFKPNDKLTRAQAAEVIYKMAGGTSLAEGTTDNQVGYETPFEDVKAGAWYAKSVQWAANNGIVNGYAGTKLFKPEANVTRQEFAIMLQRYADSKGKATATDGAKWAKITDKDTVASWATDAVKWAVDTDIMGANGWVAGKSNITRAEAAKMTTVAQPAKLK